MLQKVVHKICHVGANKRLEIDVPEEFGNEVEIIILPHDSHYETGVDSLEVMAIQEKSGFVESILSDEAEDVWNDL